MENIVTRNNTGTTGYIPRLKHDRVRKAWNGLKPWNGLRSDKSKLRKSK